MAKAKLFVVALCAIFFSLSNVNISDGAESKLPSFEPINVIIILDTSDRISEQKNSGQMVRDIEIVKKIIREFNNIVEKHIDKSDRLEYHSRLDIVIPDQPSVPPIPLEIMDKLTIEDPEEYTSYEEIMDDMKNQGKTLLDTMPKLYQLVVKHKQTGSDIWKWFKYEAKDYLSADHQNLIICISDGYLNFDKNIEARRVKGTFMEVEKLRNDPDRIRSEGLLSIGKDFSSYNAKFLMLELALRSENESGVPYQKDLEIIREYWNTWLKSMGIEKTDFVEQGRPVARKIQSFFK